APRRRGVGQPPQRGRATGLSSVTTTTAARRATTGAAGSSRGGRGAPAAAGRGRGGRGGARGRGASRGRIATNCQRAPPSTVASTSTAAPRGRSRGRGRGTSRPREVPLHLRPFMHTGWSRPPRPFVPDEEESEDDEDEEQMNEPHADDLDREMMEARLRRLSEAEIAVSELEARAVDDSGAAVARQRPSERRILGNYEHTYTLPPISATSSIDDRMTELEQRIAYLRRLEPPFIGGGTDSDSDSDDDEYDPPDEDDVEDPIAAKAEQDLREQEDQAEAKNKKLFRTKEYGACTVCAVDEVVDPAGCVYCKAFVGCRKCANRWFRSLTKLGAKSPTCPLCRHDWAGFSAGVSTMKKLIKK
ncbi:hypothetical protein PFISCL1PPCAC_25727, partial [Pristionchus fissidentatus]